MDLILDSAIVKSIGKPCLEGLLIRRSVQKVLEVASPINVALNEVPFFVNEDTWARGGDLMVTR